MWRTIPLRILVVTGMLIAGSIHASAQTCDQALASLQSRLDFARKLAPIYQASLDFELKRRQELFAAKRETARDDALSYMLTVGSCAFAGEALDAAAAYNRQLALPACKDKPASLRESRRQMEATIRASHQKCEAGAELAATALAARVAREKKR